MVDPFKQNKKKTAINVSDNAVEQLKGIGLSVAKSAAEDLVAGVGRTAVEQVFGTPTKSIQTPQTGEINQDQEVEIRKDERRRLELFKKQKEEEVFSYRDIEVSRKIQEIQFEIKRIITSSKEVEMAVKDVSVQLLPEKPGEYHLNFFEWILKLVSEARMKVEESATWLNLFISKKKQKNYWAMFKKHGTQFGLSNERAVSMQAG